MSFKWDSFSDQPEVIKDRDFKKAMRRRYLYDFILMFLKSLLILPFATLIMKFFKSNKKPSKDEFYGLCVNLDKGDIQPSLVDELGVKNLSIRVFLNDIENLESYYQFAKSFGDKNLLICIIQDRKNIENLQLLEKNLELIFDKFSDICTQFQIGNAINRLKWEFAAPKEYMDFYEVAYKLKMNKFQNITLLGPCVIDFEYYYNVATMFNFKNIKFEKIAALLYVDRRGSPNNPQYGIFDFKNKINLLFALAKLSFKSSDEIYITETNYPISGTGGYAPTSQKECVNIDDYLKFMRLYHKIAKESGKIQRVYWHQLIAPGYGLVDNRDGKIVKMPQFYEYKKIIDEDTN